MRLLSMWLFIASLLALPVISSAESVYQIELIVFSHVMQQTLDSERWPVVAKPEIELSGAMTLSPEMPASGEVHNSKGYSLLPASAFKQTRLSQKLSQSKDYQLLLHIAWRQPLGSTGDQQWVHIYGGNGYNDQGHAILSNVNGAIPYANARYWQVDGLVRFSVSRYINSQYKVFMGLPTSTVSSISNADEFSAIDSAMIYFGLDQARRMKSKELNYIAHPLYGMIVYVTPVEDQSEQD